MQPARPHHLTASHPILSYPRSKTYHAHQLPHRITGLRPNTKPVLCTCPVQRNLLVWTGTRVLVVEVRRPLRDGIVSADDLEGLCAAGRSIKASAQALSQTIGQSLSKLPSKPGVAASVVCIERINVPSLRDNNIVKRIVLVSKARQPNPKNHLVGGGRESGDRIERSLRLGRSADQNSAKVQGGFGGEDFPRCPNAE